MQTYFAINASAGSGKTYNLVQKLLMICLQSPDKSDGISHILALTFTNKAANEMKARILGWLEDFTKENFKENTELLGIQTKFKEKNINIPLEELHRRSKKVLDYILHHYSTLNIGTIDKFNARLVRSFSNELGLAQNFNLEIQSEPFLIEAVDKMLDKIGADETISEAFMDFINYKLDNEERIYINQSLYKKAKQFVSDVHYEELKSNKDFNWEIYDKVKIKLRSEIAEHQKITKEKASDIVELLKEKGLEIPDFSGGNVNGLAKFFIEYLKFFNGKRKDFPFPGDEQKALLIFEKGASTKGKSKEHLIFEIQEYLLEARKIIIKNYISAIKKEKILQELLPLKINKEIQDQLALIEEENDLVLLSKFNVLINENLKNEPSSFIYEKVGTKYDHYFLDEFQDTSKMQWDNILPLRDHTINSEDNTFTLVGDPKQSIYRFRGGESKIMLEILNKIEKTNVEVSLENLEHNWRSAKNIVDFNNELYAFLSKDLAKEHAELFNESAFQNPQKKFLGRVKVNLQEHSSKNAEFFETATAQMQKDIQEILENGFGLSDITILCRGGSEIKEFSQLLGKQKIVYNGKEQYIKTISEKGLTLDLSKTIKALIEFLHWKIQPKNRQHLVKLFYYLNESGRVYIENFTAEMLKVLNIIDQEELENYILENFQLNLNPKELPKLNLYNEIEFFVHEFSVKTFETDFLLNFLEMLYNYSQNAGNTLKDFLQYWKEEAHKISIQASDNVDAIKLMTIHAAKGLEFPIVFLPMKNSNKDKKINNWLQLEGYEELKSINIDGFSDKLESYDDEIAGFNAENIYKNKIDRYCLQYVATTRPVEQLFFYLQCNSKSGENSIELLDFIATKNPENLMELEIYPEADGSYKKQNIKKEKKFNTKNISSLTEKTSAKNNLKIATPSKNYQVRNEKVRLGIFAHEILAKINQEKDVDFVLEQYVLDGNITRNEKEIISKRLLEIVKNPANADYFNADLKIINEKDILISENGISENYRPDRLIETENGWLIVDFKTGEETDEKKKKYEKQVQTYKMVLEKLGKTVLKTEIVYV
ncbi:UvrD-helicase domain-containing protein [Halpernia frigidisoli]|uniref:DNA 3'-5' helicase n=1 Tax=Halpernia frigidisoli TaxID=1125876 RepID=A0A1I3GGD7_9FLAO|nr:UvrD-helicase domain-containing protein [Halpernia frigidisoli]SFI22504.1 ATP-dependent exoDNAse (exonuclease V) beta subunit (contains helicase and exonuclease domains) [Halpernia frigidisoli]